jgi:hypothetical protein
MLAEDEHTTHARRLADAKAASLDQALDAAEADVEDFRDFLAGVDAIRLDGRALAMVGHAAEYIPHRSGDQGRAGKKTLIPGRRTLLTATPGMRAKRAD